MINASNVAPGFSSATKWPDDTPIPVISVAMLIRGMGIGFAFMPAMAAAFASLDRSELSHATPQLNVLQRVGGSIGTALLSTLALGAQARVLTGAAPTAETVAAATAHGYTTAFWVSAGLLALGAVAAGVLPGTRNESPHAPAIESDAPVLTH